MRDFAAIHKEWLDMYNTQINSGISVEEWCLQNNIKYKTFLSRVGTLRKLCLLPYAGTVAKELNKPKATTKLVTLIIEFIIFFKQIIKPSFFTPLFSKILFLYKKGF